MISLEKRYTTRSKKRVVIEYIDDMFVHGVVKRANDGKDKIAIWFIKDGRFVGKTLDHPLSLIEQEGLSLPEEFYIMNLGITNTEEYEKRPEYDVAQIGSGNDLSEAFKSALSKLERKWNLNYIIKELGQWLSDNYKANDNIETFRLRNDAQFIANIEDYNYKVVIFLKEKVLLTDLVETEKITD